ncbi:MAG: hypothetical protein M3011_09585 [Actinomycetota bacterium]|nr:hypothetical protein [Actinomycetota bacterium]
MTGSEAISLEESARLAGHARWLETQLFEVLGSWVATECDARAKVLWSTHSLRHATGADIWSDRQPRVAHLDRDALTVAASPGVAALVAELDDLTHPGDSAGPMMTLSRLVAVARVVEPRRLDAYRNRCRRAHPLADGPTLRWVGFLLGDAERCRAEAEALLAAQVGGPDIDPDAIRAVEAEMTSLLSGNDDLIGLTGNDQL